MEVLILLMIHKVEYVFQIKRDVNLNLLNMITKIMKQSVNRTYFMWL